MTKETRDEKNAPNGSAPLERDIQTRLGDKLREVYSDVVNEPVPDRFVDLLNQLEQSEKNKTD